MIALAEQRGWRINSPRNTEHRGGTVSIDMPEAEQVCRELLNRDILVDYRPKAGVRMAPHFYNKDEELDTAIAAVDEILKERRTGKIMGRERPARAASKRCSEERSPNRTAPAFSPPARRSPELLR